MSFEISTHFPYAKIRPQQEEAIFFALDNHINQGKRFIIIEAGTGVGKSAIGLTVARYLSESLDKTAGLFEDGSYFLTTQKILQEQYVNDFGGFKGPMKSIKSSTNYTCNFNRKTSCGEVSRRSY